MSKLIPVLVTMILSFNVWGVTLKIGVLAPEGTNWAKNMKKMAKEVKAATDKKVKFKFYFGGSQGDEHDVLRKIRVGQLQGGFFTGKTLGDINGDVRVMEIPFNFEGDREKAWNTLNKLSPYFNDKLRNNEFVNLGFIEIGMVYFVSQKETRNLASMKGIKIWSWEGDKLVSSMIDELNLVSVPLALPDVLSSLSTGIIEAAYAPPMGMLALQWNTKIKYIVDFPIAYSVGAFLIHDKSWNKVKPEHRKIVQDIAKKYIDNVSKSNVKDNKAALAAMKDAGIKFIKFPDQDVNKAKAVRNVVVDKLKNKLFSSDSLNKLQSSL
jgi:TRAP-type C4-dicarboxylate transport system substrate-binding protein